MMTDPDKACKPTRINFIETIRIILIQCLVFYHTMRMFEGFSNFNQIVVRAEDPNDPLTIVIHQAIGKIQCALVQAGLNVFIFIAGMSALFSLSQRNVFQMIVERIKRLILAFLFGILVVSVPTNYVLFHSKSLNNLFWDIPEFLATPQAWAPGHLLFLPYLFAITLIYLPQTRLTAALLGRYSSKTSSPHTQTQSIAFAEAHSHSGAKATLVYTSFAVYAFLAVYFMGFIFSSTTYLFTLAILLVICVYFFLIAPKIDFIWYERDAKSLMGHQMSVGEHTASLVRRTSWPDLILNIALPSLHLATNWYFGGLLCPLSLLVMYSTMVYLPFFPEALAWRSDRRVCKKEVDTADGRDVSMEIAEITDEIEYDLWLNVPFCACMLIVVSQILLISIPSTLPIGDRNVTLNFVLFEIHQEKFFKFLMMGTCHGAFYFVGYLWLLYQDRLPRWPQNNLLSLAICTIFVLGFPLVILDKYDDMTTLTPGYYSYKKQNNRFFFSIGSWIWVFAFAKWTVRNGDEPYNLTGTFSTFTLFLKKHSFGIFFCHVLFQAIYGSFFAQLPEYYISWYGKLIATHVLVYTSSYAWCWMVSKVPVVNALVQ